MRQQTRSSRAYAVIAALALATTLAVAAAPASASVGSVYFDINHNTAAGNDLFNGTFTGDDNVGLGAPVMPNLTDGAGNIAIGFHTLFSDTGGDANTGIGDSVLINNQGGNQNTATGWNSLASNSAGNNNTAVGYRALNISTGSRNIGIGPNSGINLSTGSRNVYVANPGVDGESGKIRIGTAANQDAAFLAGVWNKTAPGPTKAVVVNSKGQLATAPAPAAPRSGKSQTISRLRDRVGQLATAVQRLRRQVRNGG